MFLPCTQIWHILFVVGKNLALCFGLILATYSFSIASVEAVNFRILGAPFNAVCGVIAPFSKFMSFKVSPWSSLGLNPVSLNMLKIVAYFFLKADIIVFICSVVGTFSSLSCLWKKGFCGLRL